LLQTPAERRPCICGCRGISGDRIDRPTLRGRSAYGPGATGEILVRGDSAYGTSAVVAACLTAGARFSVVLAKNRAVERAIAGIAEDAWTPVRYPGAVVDPDTGELISDAEVAETTFTAFESTARPVARLVVRRVRDRARGDELFAVWRHHPFLTNSIEQTAQADITHRRHAIIETVFADLIDGPLAHLPSGPVRREQRVGDLRCHHPQPAPRRRRPRQRPACRRPRRDPAPTDRQRARPAGPTAAPSHLAPAPALALGRAVDCPMEERVRPGDRATDRRVTIDHSRTRHRPETDTWKAGQTSGSVPSGHAPPGTRNQ
jgi:hypothetical protein